MFLVYCSKVHNKFGQYSFISSLTTVGLNYGSNMRIFQIINIDILSAAVMESMSSSIENSSRVSKHVLANSSRSFNSCSFSVDKQRNITSYKIFVLVGVSVCGCVYSRSWWCAWCGLCACALWCSEPARTSANTRRAAGAGARGVARSTSSRTTPTTSRACVVPPTL